VLRIVFIVAIVPPPDKVLLLLYANDVYIDLCAQVPIEELVYAYLCLELAEL
jgi:hypothetical protein